MSKIINTAKIAEKFDHFTEVHLETSICVNMNSFERSVYIFGRKFRINHYICIAVNENGEIIRLNLNNLIIAAKPKYFEDFVGYVKIDEACEKISTKYPYDYDHSFVFAFVCDNAVLSVILTKPVAANGSLSGMSIDVGMKDVDIDDYYRVMENISTVTSILKTTALRNVESNGAFTKFFEPLPTLPHKSADETAQLTQWEGDDVDV